MVLPSSGSISISQIAAEFGPNHPISGQSSGNAVKLGTYQKIGYSQSNYPQVIGGLSFSTLDGGGSIPTSGQIKMSDFRGTRLQQVVNFWSSGAGGNRLNAKDRYNTNGSIGSDGHVAVVGGFRSRPNNSSGTKVHIHVNQDIGSERFQQNHCALRTGTWNPSTQLQVDIGGSGRVQGAGGFGGNGANGNTSGSQGGFGTSGLGVEYGPTTVNVASGGFLSAGFGGGGGGGGAFDYDHKSWRTASGGGGGGGAGTPVGQRGTGGSGGSGGSNGANGVDFEQAGGGGGGGNNGGEAVGGAGGAGGQPANESADAGANGSGGEGSGGSGGPAGATGSAIRRTDNSISVTINNSGSIHPNQTLTNGVG